MPHPLSLGERESRSERTPPLSLRGIKKRYERVKAVDDVDLDVAAGEIRGILGENGAGKSTLMGIISGTILQDEGTVIVRGKAVPPGDPSAAIRAGVAMVFQHSKLVPIFSVAENASLARTRSGQLFDVASAARRLKEVSARYGLDVNPDAKVEAISVGARQRAEILRALLQTPEILILDEPTALLTPQETKQLFVVMRRLSEEGRAVLLLTHRLEEILEVCDSVTILRRGRVVGTQQTAKTTLERLAEEMVGGFLDDHRTESGSARDGPREVALSIRDLTVQSTGGIHLALEGFSADVHQGSVVGVVGVDGNGQDALMDALCGLVPYSGRVELQGVELPMLSPSACIRRGMARIPGDRHHDGLVMSLPIWENLTLGRLKHLGLKSRLGFLRRDRAVALSRELIRRFDIRIANPEAPASSASGGNQQKIVLARELSSSPAVLVAMNPTRGLDVASTIFVRRHIKVAAMESGMAVLLITSDLDEALELADELHVLSRGRIQGTVSHDLNESKIGLLMGGVGAGQREAN